MSGTFDPTWLALRERIDHRSRAPELTRLLHAWWWVRGAESVLDLGSGTGSNLTYLAGTLPTPQRWTLVDQDADLLARVRRPAGDLEVRTVVGDLADVGLREVPGSDLVTASALLDLVSEAWLTALADACASARAGVLFALTYDGTVEWSSAPDTDDGLVRDAVNGHQRRDKGMGPALGPTAGRVAERLLRARGYKTRLADSPWQLGPKDADLAGALIVGWASAAAEQQPAEADRVRAWAERRTQAFERGETSLTVGHQDLLALPAAEAPEDW